MLFDLLPAPLRERYAFVRELGAGGMGVVYLVEDRELARRAALKVVEVRSPGERRRFQREAEALSRVRHPHVVEVYDYGELEEQPYLVMEYVEGEELDEGHPDPLRPMLQVAEALEAIHAAGLVHRDVKPRNILLRPNGDAVLVDFGLVLDPDASSRLTRDGAMVGTLGFTSPEAVRGDPVTAAADWYSWGATLYMLLEGRGPYTSLDMMAHMRGDPLPPVTFDRLPARDPRRRALEALLRGEPSARPAGLGELRRLLARSSGSAPVPTVAPGRAGVPFLLGVLVGVGGTLGALSLPAPSVSPPPPAPAPAADPAREPLAEAARRLGMEDLLPPGSEIPFPDLDATKPRVLRILPYVADPRTPLRHGRIAQEFMERLRDPVHPDLPLARLAYFLNRIYSLVGTHVLEESVGSSSGIFDLPVEERVPGVHHGVLYDRLREMNQRAGAHLLAPQLRTEALPPIRRAAWWIFASLSAEEEKNRWVPALLADLTGAQTPEEGLWALRAASALLPLLTVPGRKGLECSAGVSLLEHQEATLDRIEPDLPPHAQVEMRAQILFDALSLPNPCTGLQERSNADRVRRRTAAFLRVAPKAPELAVLWRNYVYWAAETLQLRNFLGQSDDDVPLLAAVDELQEALDGIRPPPDGR